MAEIGGIGARGKFGTPAELSQKLNNHRFLTPPSYGERMVNADRVQQ
jgi:hypothetical protein